MKKAAIVTGASSGIGAATAKQLSREGYFVFLGGRNEERLHEVALQCPSGASLLKMDLQKSDSLKKYSEHLKTRPDVSIEVLVNNAGIFSRSSFEDGGLESWRQQFEVNLFGTIEWTLLILPFLKKSGKGSIVNVASTLGLKPVPTTGAYSASKAALINWTHSLALELAKVPVRVNCVAPGLVDTPIHDFHSMPTVQKTEALNAMSSRVPMGKVGTPEQIAEAICFLAGEKSNWTTGAVLSVDGGINLA